MFFFQRNSSPLCSISRSIFLSLFLSLTVCYPVAYFLLLGLGLGFSFCLSVCLSVCLSFSFSIFQIYDMTINLSWSVQRHWNTSRWVWDKDWWKWNFSRTPRQIPYMIKDKNKAELRGRDGHYHQGWPTCQVAVNPIVVVRKSNGDVLICLDPVDLNKAIKRELTLPLITVEEVAASMSEAKVFSTLDAMSEIYQIKLTE